MEIEQFSDELIQYGFDHQMQDLYYYLKVKSTATFFGEVPSMNIKTRLYPMLIMKCVWFLPCS